MKKIIAIALVFVLVFQFAGLYCYYALRLIEIHYEMEEQLAEAPAEMLEKFVFTEAQYQKASVEKGEVKVNGKMFDVARVEKHDDRIIVYALHDKSEDDLISFVEMVMKKSHQGRKNKSRQVLKLISLQYLPSIFTFTDSPSPHSVAVTSVNLTYEPFEPGLHTPPPRS